MVLRLGILDPSSVHGTYNIPDLNSKDASCQRGSFIQSPACLLIVSRDLSIDHSLQKRVCPLYSLCVRVGCLSAVRHHGIMASMMLSHLSQSIALTSILPSPFSSSPLHHQTTHGTCLSAWQQTMMVRALERHSGEALAVALIFAYQFLCIDGFPVLDADRSVLTTQNLLSFERNGFIRIPSLLSKDEVTYLKGNA